MNGEVGGSVPPPTWYTVEEGTTVTFHPSSCILQQRSISSMWAKNLSSRPPSLRYTELRTIRHAPVAQNTSTGESYCPSSFSTRPMILPRQNGYPKRSMYPPAAPAYSNISLCCPPWSLGAHAPHSGWVSIHSTSGPSQSSGTSMSEFIRRKYSGASGP